MRPIKDDKLNEVIEIEIKIEDQSMQESKDLKHLIKKLEA